MLVKKFRRPTSLLAATAICAVSITQFVKAYPSVYPTGVTRYDPEKAYNGYVLLPLVANYGEKDDVNRLSEPGRLIDMNGNVVHTWTVGSWQRYQLLPGECNLMLIEDPADPKLEGINYIVEYDWDSNEVWRWRPEQTGQGGRMSATQSHMLHHQFERQANGETLVMWSIPVPKQLTKDIKNVNDPWFGRMNRRGLTLIGDELAYVTKKGEVTWTWRAHDHISVDDFMPGWPRLMDWSHGNAVSAIPENRHWDAGDERFKPGNVVFNPRNFPYFLVISKDTGEVVFKGQHKYKGGFSGQHESHMIPKGLPGAGNFLVFDNGANSRNETHHGHSFVVEIDPSKDEVVWLYEAQGASARFYSHSRGAVQRLPNGNTLVSEDTQGRIFQVRPDESHVDGGEIVWEYVAFNTDEKKFNSLARTKLYSYDHCDRFAEIPRSELKVTPPSASDWRVLPDVQRKGGDLTKVSK